MIDGETIRWILTAVGGVVMYLWKRQQDEAMKERASMLIDIQLLKDTRLHKDDFREFKVELRNQFLDLKEAIKALTPHAG